MGADGLGDTVQSSIRTMACATHNHRPPRSPSPLLTLPAEIRDQIYHNVLGFPDLKPAFEEMRKRDKKTKVYWFSNDVLRFQWRKRRGVRLAPPSILLVNRLTSRDALDLLFRKTLVLDSPSSDCTATDRLFDITEFISQSVLQRVEWVVLKLDFSINGGKVWMRYLEMLSDTCYGGSIL